MLSEQDVAPVRPNERARAAAGTRGELLDATVRLIRRRGLAGFTTRDIAREAGVSDGALYVHFRTKDDLVVECCQRSVPDWAAAQERLRSAIGVEPVERALVDFAAAGVRFYRQLAPLSSGLGSDQVLLERNRQRWRDQGAGPASAVRTLTQYIATEQRLGRIPPVGTPAVMCGMLLGACHLRATLAHLLGSDHEPEPADDADFARETVAALLGARSAPLDQPVTPRAGDPEGTPA